MEKTASGFYGFVAASKLLVFSEIGIVEQPTVTVDLIDKGALSLLRDMERLNLIRVNSPEKTAAAPEGRLSERFAGALRLSAGDAALPEKSRGQSRDEAFRRALRRAYGAWADKPWENAAADINALRDEWDHRDPWNPDPSKRHRD